MTPNHIEILLHCHCSAAPHPRLNAQAVVEAFHDLERMGLIELSTGSLDRYGTTARGEAHVRQLCNLPLPIMKWMSGDGKAID